MEARPHTRAPRPSWLVLPADPDGATTVLDHLLRRFPKIDRATWIDRMRRGLVHAEDDTPIDPCTPYRAHWRIAYYREVRDQPRVPFEATILHLDERIVVVDKPPFLPVTPAGPFVTECLIYRLQERLGDDDLAPAHRLDRHTSGVVVCVRDARDRGAYSRLFARADVDRVYEALGHLDRDPPQHHWRVIDRLAAGEPFFRQRRVAGLPNAETEIELVSWADGIGRFRLRPATGKQHQLRLHLAALGFPIVGDRYYPTLQPEQPDDHAAPLRLIARSLAFVDPITGTPRRFVSRRSLDQPTATRRPSSRSGSSADRQADDE